ncbi:MAG: hypothetical protein QNK37_12595 [Acidobacteriota bacterium]|nr:hypothetical protein [Acidobacteriota bacterium]
MSKPQQYFFLGCLLVGGYLIVDQWPCLRFQLTETPEIIRAGMADQQTREVVYLYGGNLCTVCPSGNELRTFQDRAVLCVFEEEVGDGEIQNFMETYNIEGFAIRGNEEVAAYLKRMAACRGMESRRGNFLFSYGKTKPHHIHSF